VQRFQENKFLLRCHKGAIVFNLRPTENFDKLPGKFTFFQALIVALPRKGLAFTPLSFQNADDANAMNYFHWHQHYLEFS